MPVTVTWRPGVAHCGLTDSMTTDSCRPGCDACRCACWLCACWLCACWARAAGPAPMPTASVPATAPARQAIRLAAPGRRRPAAGPVDPARPGVAWVRDTVEMLLPPAECGGLCRAAGQ